MGNHVHHECCRTSLRSGFHQRRLKCEEELSCSRWYSGSKLPVTWQSDSQCDMTVCLQEDFVEDVGELFVHSWHFKLLLLVGRRSPHLFYGLVIVTDAFLLMKVSVSCQRSLSLLFEIFHFFLTHERPSYIKWSCILLTAFSVVRVSDIEYWISFVILLKTRPSVSIPGFCFIQNFKSS